MQRRPPQIPGEDLNVHASLLSKVADAILWLLGSAFAIWLLCSIVLPLAAGFMGKADRLVDAFRQAAAFEGQVASILAPRVAFGETVLLEEGWNYRSGVNIARAIAPQEQDGAFLDDQLVSNAKHNEAALAADGAPPPPSQENGQPTIRNAAVEGFSQKMHAWMSDRFWPVQRAMITIAVTRGWQALELLLVFIPIALCAYFWGESVARERDRQGEMPLGHRYQIYIRIAMFIVPSFPVVIVLPLAFPGAAVLLLMFIGLTLCIGLARSHTAVEL